MIQKVNSLSSNVYTSHGEILKVFFFFFKYVDLPSNTVTLCVQNIAHKNEALHGYVSPRVGPRELYRLEIALKIIITVPTDSNLQSYQ